MADKANQDANEVNQQENAQGTEGADPASEKSGKTAEYIKELNKEKAALDVSSHPVAVKLIEAEIAAAQKGKYKDPKNVFDLYRDRPIKASVKISVPVKEYPRFNFVGKLLGVRGSTLKRLQADTMTKIAILGRGSMRDKAKEDECRASLDPKYNHLNDDLHIEIFANGPPAEAHARLAYAMVEVRKYLTPDPNEEGQGGGEGGGGPMRGRGGGRGGYRGGMMGPPPIPPRAAAGANTVMSILDRARMSMEGGYNQFEEGPPPAYGGGGYDGYDNGAGGYNEFDYGAGGAGAPPAGRWKGYGPKGAAGGSRFPPRPSPYSRPLK